MIDYEVKIFNRVHAKVAPLCAKQKFTSTIITDLPTAFPAASLIEMDNGQKDENKKEGVWLYSSFVLWDGDQIAGEVPPEEGGDALRQR